jgi:hypothetical protein
MSGVAQTRIVGAALSRDILRVDDANVLTVLRALLFELYEAVFLREQCVIAADANIASGVYAGATLTNNNVSGNSTLAAK